MPCRKRKIFAIYEFFYQNIIFLLHFLHTFYIIFINLSVKLEDNCKQIKLSGVFTMRKVQLFLVAALLVAAFSMTAYAAEWKNNDQGWWYEKDDGSYPANKLEKVGEYWYYFNEAGYAQAGFVKLDTGWYYLQDNGVCQNPIDPATQLPVGAPNGGWIVYDEFFGTKEELGAVYYNNFYWIKFYDVQEPDSFNANTGNFIGS